MIRPRWRWLPTWQIWRIRRSRSCGPWRICCTHHCWMKWVLRARQSGTSRAAHVTVCFRHQFEKVILEIRDDGCGIEGERLVRLRETSAETGVGLAGMRERMYELNGTLEIESEGRGTTIRAVVPLRAGTPSLSQVAEDSRKRAPQSSEYQISPLRSGDAGIAAD